jgi:methyl-accepting chemotaxis protein
MDEVTQQNAALVEEASAAARAMQDQAAGLRQQMLFFRLDGAPAEAPARQDAGAASPRATRRAEAMRPVAAAAGAWTEF